MYEPVLVDEKSDLYNVYEVHENYRILAMAVNVPLQVAEEICHILNNFEPVILKTCPICDQSVTINEYISDYLYSINCECCGLKTRRFRSKQNLIKYWNATKSEQAMRYLQMDYESMFDREKRIMSTYMTLEEYTATLKVGDEVTIKYYSITGEKEIKEKILKITKSGTIYLRSTNCKDALRFRKNGHWINNFGYQGFITSKYSLKNPYQKPFDFTQVKV